LRSAEVTEFLLPRREHGAVGQRRHRARGRRFTSGEGAAFVFVRSGSTWTQQARLEARKRASSPTWATACRCRERRNGARGRARERGSLRRILWRQYVFVREGGVMARTAKLIATTGATTKGAGLQCVAVGERRHRARWARKRTKNRAAERRGGVRLHPLGLDLSQQGGAVIGKHPRARSPRGRAWRSPAMAKRR